MTESGEGSHSNFGIRLLSLTGTSRSLRLEIRLLNSLWRKGRAERETQRSAGLA